MSRRGQIMAVFMILFLITITTIEVPFKVLADSDNGKSEDEDLYFEALDKPTKESYIVENVKMGTVANQHNGTAAMYFPKYETVTVPTSYGPVKLEKMLVKIGQMVKKGTPVVKITTEIDEVDLEEQSMSLERAEDQYHRLITKQTKDLQEQKKALGSIEDKMVKKIATLEYEKAQLNYKITKRNQEKQISELKQQISESKSIQKITELLAPTDGYVFYVALFEKGEKIDSTTSLVKIADPSDVCFKIATNNQDLQYNMNVTLDIPTGEDNKKLTLKGKGIVSNLGMISDEEVAYYFIKPDKKVTLDEVKGKTVDATVDICIMDNVLVAPAGSVITDDSISNSVVATTYVLSGDTLEERLFIPGLSNTAYCQVIAGLEEGTEIVKRQ